MSSRRWALLLMVTAVMLAALVERVKAQTAEPPAAQGSPVHPAIVLLDGAGQNVLDSGEPVSTLTTCGQCHDTAYIQQHNSHAMATANHLGAAWDPLLYRYLSTAGDTRPDLDEVGWLQQFGQRLPSGPLTELNCFLCHLALPDHAARLAALQRGDFEWANTATLAATGVVAPGPEGWEWNRSAFGHDGELARETLGLQDPADANCAQCHTAAHAPAQALPNVTGAEPDKWPPDGTATTGQIYAPELISASGLNLAGKDDLTRAWDVHAARGLHCTDCHFAPNNPVHDFAPQTEAAEHLVFDPRRLELGDYVQRPSHDFSASAQCTDCHAAEVAHDWLPYAAQHMDALACETCHVPQTYAPALAQVDWTVLTPAALPRTIYRGTDGASGTPADLVTGFTPALLARGMGEAAVLAPYNLITAWYWQHDNSEGQARPVRFADLQAAYFNADGEYALEVVSAFDADHDGDVSQAELVVDSADKVAAIAARLAAQGLANPRITGEVRPYALNHTVTTGAWATGDCRACHGDASRLAEPMLLAAGAPEGGLPTFMGTADVQLLGSLSTTDETLVYTPDASEGGRYVFGHDRAAWADWLGALAFLGVLAAVVGHGGLRLYAALRAPRAPLRTRRVYMYAVYERFWHWLQSFTIILLLVTGLIIHRPDLFALFSFRHVVVVHNVLGGILVVNAALALFYHLASGEIRQYLPRPYGFFDQAFQQAHFYLRGIFRGRPHPFEKTPARKLNPLQQITYIGILNVLLPLQIVTGVLMWGAQQWPDLAARLGGLPLLAPLHGLVAWLFGAFIVAHVYLTSTGPAPLSGINAMMNGWEAVDDHAPGQEVTEYEHTDTHPATPDARATATTEDTAL